MAAGAPGVGKILEKDLIEPGQIRHSLGAPPAPFVGMGRAIFGNEFQHFTVDFLFFSMIS